MKDDDHVEKCERPQGHHPRYCVRTGKWGQEMLMVRPSEQKRYSGGVPDPRIVKLSV